MTDTFDPEKYGDHKRKVSTNDVVARSAKTEVLHLTVCAHEVSRNGRVEQCFMTLDNEGDCPNASAHLS
mgnify:CR=1 FL=1